jgi:CO/xanthine dehydrogenase FAD-binding subunit
MAFTLDRPESVAAALEALARGGSAVPLAGGTDLLLDLDAGRASADRLVSLARLPWRYLRREGERLRIGSTLPLRTLERHSATALPGLHEALRSVGSPALRQQATLGGNIARASPASDLLPILLALEARIAIVGPAGERVVALDELLIASRRVALGPAELIESIDVPARAACAYAWQRVRPANDISQVGVAVARPDPAKGWTVALGSVLPRPRRVPSAEAALQGARPTEEERRRAAAAAAEAAPFATDRRASEAYRRRLVEVLVRRALDAAIGPGGGS